ncbi:hypothetical protein C2S07_04210 [Helicobacter pylori]|nr:hypothetical protein C2S07_04210 [Helicobacter pylori]
MIIKIAQSQVVGLEISKTQILHENINKSGYKNLKNERHVKKDMCISVALSHRTRKAFWLRPVRNPAIKVLNQSKTC